MLVTASESCTFAGENPYEVTCPVGESAVLIAGVYRSEEERRRILTLLEEGNAEAALERTKVWWSEKASPLEIQTPDQKCIRDRPWTVTLPSTWMRHGR